MDPDQDLEQIGEDFAVSLQDLTFNSKPIITTLTMIAQENINAAEQITTAVEQRIDKVCLRLTLILPTLDTLLFTPTRTLILTLYTGHSNS